MAFDSGGTVNKVILIGRLGKDPELKYTANGTAVLTLSVATNTSYKDNEGNSVENTEWNRVVVWRKKAEAVANYTQKGSRIYVEGKLRTRSWDDQNGNKRYTTEIQADQVQFLDSKGNGGKGSEASSEAEAAPAPEPEVPEESSESEDDLPF